MGKVSFLIFRDVVMLPQKSILFDVKGTFSAAIISGLGMRSLFIRLRDIIFKGHVGIIFNLLGCLPMLHGYAESIMRRNNSFPVMIFLGVT